MNSDWEEIIAGAREDVEAARRDYQSAAAAMRQAITHLAEQRQRLAQLEREHGVTHA